MPKPQEPLFSLEEIRPALSHLSIDEQDIVIASLCGFAERKSEDLKNRKFTHTILSFAAEYHRVSAENHSHSNIEGWSENLDGTAQQLIQLTVGRNGGLSETEILARDTAAAVHIFYVLEWDEPEVDYELLHRAGVNHEDLLTRFQNGVIEAHVEAGQNREEVVADVTSNFRTLEDFSMNLYPSYWEKIIDPQAAELRAKLIEAGYDLPELNEDGMYGDDDDPKITV